MSEIIGKGIAITTVASCALLIGGAAVAAGRAISKIVEALSEAEKKEYERLKETLQNSRRESYLSPAMAKKEAQDLFENLRQLSGERPPAQFDSTRVLTLLALQKASLGKFIPEAEWMRFAVPGDYRKLFPRLLQQASQRMMESQFHYVTNAVSEAASAEGFVNPRYQHMDHSHGVISMTDKEGRGVVARATATDDGVAIDLDLTGYGDGRCHQVMDRLLERLSQKGVMIRNARRKSHYRREGISSDWLKPIKKPAPAVLPAEGQKKSDDLKRRQKLLLSQKNKNR